MSAVIILPSGLTFTYSIFWYVPSFSNAKTSPFEPYLNSGFVSLAESFASEMLTEPCDSGQVPSAFLL